MHVLIINGSPRVKKYSNTNKILKGFIKGMRENGDSFQQFEISDRKRWEEIRKAFEQEKNILIALPLYVECIPGLLMEFLETLKPKCDGTKLSFILQGGFAEGIQLRCGEEYLKILTGRLGCIYGGTLVKGGNFGIRFMEGKALKKLIGAYTEMGREFSRNRNFDSPKCKRFTGPEIFPAPIRFLVGTVFKNAAKKGFEQAAESLGGTKPLDFRPYA